MNDNDIGSTVVTLRAPVAHLSEDVMQTLVDKTRFVISEVVESHTPLLREQMEAVCRAGFAWVRFALAKDEGVHVSAIGEDAVIAAFSFLGALAMDAPESPRAT